MADKTYKKIEIVGTSSESFSDAVRRGVAKASQTLHHLDWFEVVEQRGRLAEDGVAEYQVTLKIGLRLD